MPLGLNLGALSGRLAQRGQQEAAAQQRTASFLSSIPAASIGAWNEENARKLEEQREIDTNKYYNELRLANQLEREADVRQTTADREFQAIFNRSGGDLTAIANAMSEYPDVTPELQQAWDERRALIQEDETRSALRDTALLNRSRQVTQDTAHGLTAIQSSQDPIERQQLYMQARDTLVREALKSGIPEDEVLKWLPKKYDSDAIDATIQRGLSHADFLSWVEVSKDAALRAHGAVMPIEPEAYNTAAENYKEQIVTSLMGVSSRDQAEQLWNGWEGLAGGYANVYSAMGKEPKRTIPAVMLDQFEELRPENFKDVETYKSAVKKRFEEVMPAEQRTAFNTLIEALRTNDMEGVSRVVEAQRMLYGERESARGVGSAGGDPSKDRERATLAQVNTYMERAAEDLRELTSDIFSADTDEPYEDRVAQAKTAAERKREVVRSALNTPTEDEEWDLREVAREWIIETDWWQEQAKEMDPSGKRVIWHMGKDGKPIKQRMADYPPPFVIDAFLEDPANSNVLPGWSYGMELRPLSRPLFRNRFEDEAQWIMGDEDEAQAIDPSLWRY